MTSTGVSPTVQDPTGPFVIDGPPFADSLLVGLDANSAEYQAIADIVGGASARWWASAYMQRVPPAHLIIEASADTQQTFPWIESTLDGSANNRMSFDPDFTFNLRVDDPGLYVVTAMALLVDPLDADESLSMRLLFDVYADIAAGFPATINGAVGSGQSATLTSVVHNNAPRTATVSDRCPISVDFDGSSLAANKELDYARVEVAFFGALT